ncbi:MAG: hypothetical protein NTX00_01610 [Candidatus Parcubacteria bacterium]|nr:hypothetical protein [Candidatus Parcubacteria bacterium]
MILWPKLAKTPLFKCLIIAFIITLFFPVKSSAQAANINLPEGLVFENIFWAAGENINLKAQIKDDLYLVGVNVEVSGPVEGDVIIVGSNVIINSEIKGNLRVLGGTVIIKGKIAQNVSVAGGIVTLASESEVGKNLLVAGSNVEIDGKINKNLYAAARNLILNGEILGSTYATIEPKGNMILNSGTNIHGNLEYTAQQLAEIKSGAKVGNEEKFTQWKIEPKEPLKEKFNLFFLTCWLAGLLGSLAVGLLLIFVFKNFTVKVQKELDKNIIITILKGLVYLIVMPIALIILAVTIIGLPLALILGALFLIAIYLSKIFVSIYLGERVIAIFNKKIEVPLVWKMILGLLIICLLCLIPYFGWFIRLGVTLWGIGVLLNIIKKDLKLENI